MHYLSTSAATSRRIVFYTPLESLAPRVESSPIPDSPRGALSIFYAVFSAATSGVSPLQPNAFLSLPACIIRRVEFAYCDTPTHFASVQRNAKNFASVVITLRNKGLFGSHDFWHGVCIKHKHQQKFYQLFERYQNALSQKSKRKQRKNQNPLNTERLEQRAMFSVSPVEPVVALDVGPVNQAGYDCQGEGHFQLAESSWRYSWSWRDNVYD